MSVSGTAGCLASSQMSVEATVGRNGFGMVGSFGAWVVVSPLSVEDSREMGQAGREEVCGAGGPMAAVPRCWAAGAAL